MTDQEYNDKRAQLATLKQQVIQSVLDGDLNCTLRDIARALEAELYQELCRRCAEVASC